MRIGNAKYSVGYIAVFCPIGISHAAIECSINETIRTKQKKISTLDNEISNLIKVIASTGSSALVDKLRELESEKSIEEHEIERLKTDVKNHLPDKKELLDLFAKAKKMLIDGSIGTKYKLINRFVEQVVIYRDSIDIKFNLDEDIKIKVPQTTNLNSPVTLFTPPHYCGFDVKGL